MVANPLNIDLHGKVVVLFEDIMEDAYRGIEHRLLRVDGGFGASPATAGEKLHGTFLLDMSDTGLVPSSVVERLATEDEIADVAAKRGAGA